MDPTFSISTLITNVRVTNAASGEIIEDTTERSKAPPSAIQRTTELLMPLMPQFCRRKGNLSCHLSLPSAFRPRRSRDPRVAFNDEPASASIGGIHDVILRATLI